MSEENVSKLRLKPKLAADPGAASQSTSVNPPAPAVAEEAKGFRLKPKLSAAPAQASEGVATPQPAVIPAPTAAFAPSASAVTAASEPVVETGEIPAKFNLKPKEAADTTPPNFPLPVPDGMEATSPQDPIPAPDFVEPEEAVAPAVVPGIRTETARPFPPPPANFPPPTATDGRPAPPWANPVSAARGAPPKKNFVLLGGGAIVLLLGLGGAFIAYKKFTAAPDAPAPKASVAARPKKPEATVQAVVEKAKEEAAAPINEILTVPPPAVVGPAQTTPVTAPDVAVAPVVTPAGPPVVVAPPPPASAAFKAWVDALRVGGVRTGATTRVFIGGISYVSGDVVNSELGISFDSYNAETRKLTFVDKTGAKVDRRN